MKAAFIHDHYFVYNPKDSRYYDGSGGVFDYKLWKRYLAVFDSLIVVGRQKEALPNKLVDSTYENVSFELRDELKLGIDRFKKRKIIKRELDKTLSTVDFTIIRLPSVLGYIAQEICEENAIPYTLEVVTCPWDAYWNYGSLAGKLIAPLEFWKLKQSAKRAENVIYVTQNFLQRRYPSYKHQIGISNVLINNRKDIKEIADFYKNKTPDIFKIGLIGSFHVKWKGHAEAIKAIASVVKSGNQNIRLYLVGTGDFQWVKDLVAQYQVGDYVEILGTLDSGDKGIFPFLDSLHLYIHPSRQEGLPRVVIEALSRGRLVLGSSAAGIPELLDKEWLHNPGDWEQLATQINYFYQNRAIWEKISEANWARSADYFEERLQNNRENFIKESLC
ncbi:MAG: glycosyltransferase family 4 protein [Sphingobacterium siyangense]